VEWVKRCHQADEKGIRADLGATRGECVNRERGPASENARNSIAGLCGVEKFQQDSGFGTKGECIQALGGGNGGYAPAFSARLRQ
jgi:hypothetical protein